VQDSSICDRLNAVFDHLSIKQAPVAACMSADWSCLVGPASGRVTSLAVVAPHLNQGVPATAGGFKKPVVVIAGDEGAPAERSRELAGHFPTGTFVPLAGYSSPIWANTVSDRLQEVSAALTALWEAGTDDANWPAGQAFGPEGTVAGISYRIEGKGPPVVLLPLSLSATQWSALVEHLRERFSFITLGGAYLGAIALLEGRAQSGYADLVASIIASVGPAASGEVLEVGCGSGALVRWGAARGLMNGQIVATDLNPYLLSQARSLAQAEGLSERIRFEEANGTQLPYEENTFDLAFSATVLEEAPAEPMLGELVRVTKPGGRIVAMTRAIDVDWWANLAVPDDMRRRLHASGPATGAGVGKDGCADASLYYLATAAGLEPLQIGPQFAADRRGPRLQDVLPRLKSTLPEHERGLFQEAVDAGQKDGTLVVCEPFHCFVGKVPD
jgi:SAM-dependent methyltransferase